MVWLIGAGLVPWGMLRAADPPPSAVGSLLKLYQSGRLPAERQPAVVEMICNRGNEHDLRIVYERVLQPDGMAGPLRLKALGWLSEAARTRKVKPAGDLAQLAELVESGDAPLRLAAVRLAGTLAIPQVSGQLRQLAADRDAPEELRQAAIAALTLIGGDENRETLRQLAVQASSVATRMQAVAAMAGFDLPAAAVEGAALLAGASPEDDPALLLDAFFDRKDASTLLAQALGKHKLSRDVAKRALRYMYSVGRSDADLSAVLSEAAGVVVDPPPPTQEEVANLVREVLDHGDAARGEKVFRRADLSCMRCHSLNRAGGQVGPDLSAVGGSSPVDYIVNSVLNPNLAVKEQFVTRVIETADGKVLTGILIDRDESRVRIRDVQGKTLIIPTADIDAEGEGASMMPSGLTKFLTHAELLDLVRFVSELGKPGEYAVRPATTIQRWRVLQQPAPELIDGVPHLEILRQHVLDSPPEAWGAVYATHSGRLPLDELRSNRQPRTVLLRGEFQVSDAGQVAVAITCSEKFQVWIDSQGFESAAQFTVTAEPGRHLVIIRVEISDRAQPELKVELTRPAGSPVQFEVVGGA
ncbi:MAG: hypothetical protein ACKV0T_05015 [Planctomycetales bacterium]